MAGRGRCRKRRCEGSGIAAPLATRSSAVGCDEQPLTEARHRHRRSIRLPNVQGRCRSGPCLNSQARTSDAIARNAICDQTESMLTCPPACRASKAPPNPKDPDAIAKVQMATRKRCPISNSRDASRKRSRLVVGVSSERCGYDLTGARTEAPEQQVDGIEASRRRNGSREGLDAMSDRRGR